MKYPAKHATQMERPVKTKLLCCTVNPYYKCHICEDTMCVDCESWGLCTYCSKQVDEDPTFGLLKQPIVVGKPTPIKP